MSFFRKKKEVDFLEQEKAIDKEIAVERNLAEKAKAEEEPALNKGEVRVREIETQPKHVVSDETSRERNRLKYKDTTGLVTSQEKNSYPTFNVFYLGRIPTSVEYGMEAVESPVDQLCRLRDKQKLPKVAVTFDTEGLTIKELSSSLFSKNKSKKDGIDIYLPLHHITYGVASEAHPLVFACISRMAEDDTPHDDGMPVLMLYAFLCDKVDTAQQITYWQLQAYIEAYEELKRKKILRNRRKQALGSRKPAASMAQRKAGSAGYDQPLPLYGNEPPPPLEEEEENGNDIPKKGYKVKNKGYSKPKSDNGYIPDSDINMDKEQKASSPLGPSSPTEKSRSGSITSEDSQGGSRDVAFERRISEMNDLMVEMDAEKLKKLMISNHASLARSKFA
ncbi:hypothetical protein BSL78_26208 [Apostichopus japonicus]|uniref:PID domain-containing protein n=1 Tax=Stichopus japonicus TaxID=307972 RepID=A0A2G8JMM4_STIJA|nr:hypothetical protein BSL78_26208 [Apostichopus japonicus]